VRGDPSTFAPRLRALVERADPALGVDEVMPLHAVRDGELSLTHAGALLAYAVFMLAVCLLACAVPTRRALSIEPTEALKAE
jgi:hypothetical protein